MGGDRLLCEIEEGFHIGVKLTKATQSFHVVAFPLVALLVMS